MPFFGEISFCDILYILYTFGGFKKPLTYSFVVVCSDLGKKLKIKNKRVFQYVFYSEIHINYQNLAKLSNASRWMAKLVVKTKSYMVVIINMM